MSENKFQAKSNAAFMDKFVLNPGNLKAAMKNAGATARDMRMVPYEKLRVLPGFNQRDMTPEYKAHLDWLTDQMVRYGWKAEFPLPVIIQKEGDEEVIYYSGGHSRMICAQRARELGKEIDFVPVVPKPRGTNKLDLWTDQVLDNTGLRNSLRELGNIYYQMTREGCSIREVAERIGRSEQHVKDALDTRVWPVEIRDAVIEGKISATEALKLWRQHGPEAINKLQAGLAQAQAQGRSRVTGKSFSGPRIPPRVLQSAAKAVETLVAGLDESVRAALAEPKNPAEDGQDAAPEAQEQMVPVPMSLLRELMRSQQEIEKVREQAAKKAAKTKKAAQEPVAEDAADAGGTDDDSNGAAESVY